MTRIEYIERPRGVNLGRFTGAFKVQLPGVVYLVPTTLGYLPDDAEFQAYLIEMAKAAA